jgi:hypothetical protein
MDVLAKINVEKNLKLAIHFLQELAESMIRLARDTGNLAWKRRETLPRNTH